jgi:hypothetical protein
MSNNIQTEISIPRKTAELYIQANREIEKRLGQAPGAEVLMSLVVEQEDPTELADDYCRILLQQS